MNLHKLYKYLVVFILFTTIFSGCGNGSSSQKTTENNLSTQEDELDLSDAPPVLTSTPTVPFRLKKTGQSISYDAEGNVVADRSQRDDGYYQKGATPSYTRDDDKETVLDNLTGLTWQDDEAVISVTKPFFSSDVRLTSSQRPARFYCEQLVMSEYEDWRLPRVEELETLVDYGVNSPTIDTTFKYTETSVGKYWSSDEYGYPWVVDFHRGEVYTLPTNLTTDDDLSAMSFLIRCVRDKK